MFELIILLCLAGTTDCTRAGDLTLPWNNGVDCMKHVERHRENLDQFARVVSTNHLKDLIWRAECRYIGDRT